MVLSFYKFEGPVESHIRVITIPLNPFWGTVIEVDKGGANALLTK